MQEVQQLKMFRYNWVIGYKTYLEKTTKKVR